MIPYCPFAQQRREVIGFSDWMSLSVVPEIKVSTTLPDYRYISSDERGIFLYGESSRYIGARESEATIDWELN